MLFCAGVALAASALFGIAEPAVARPTIPKRAASQSSGTVFFIEVAASGAIAAIGTAHTLRISDIAKAGRVEFRLDEAHVGRAKGHVLGEKIVVDRDGTDLAGS